MHQYSTVKFEPLNQWAVATLKSSFRRVVAIIIFMPENFARFL
jgi:hypothetical protein